MPPNLAGVETSTWRVAESYGDDGPTDLLARRVVGHEAALHRGDENVARAGVIAPAVLRGTGRSKAPQLPLMARPRRVVWRSARRTEGCCSGACTGREHEEQDVPSSRAARPAGGSNGRSLPGLCRNRRSPSPAGGHRVAGGRAACAVRDTHLRRGDRGGARPRGVARRARGSHRGHGEHGRVLEARLRAIRTLSPTRTVWLVNPAHIKAVPGRKTDVKDSAWIAKLLMHGLLSPSFVA